MNVAKLLFAFSLLLFTNINYIEAQSSWADETGQNISVDVKNVKILSGLKNPQIYKTIILFDNDSSVQTLSAAKLNVQTTAKFVKVKARKSLFENGDILKLTDTEYLLIGPGKYAVEIATFDPEKGIDEKTISVEIGEIIPPTPPTPPTPPNPPSPNIPDDKFDNIGKKVALWSIGLPKRTEVAEIYKEISTALNESPLITVNDAGGILTKKRAEVLGQDLTKYSSFIENLSNDLKSRWPLNRKDYAEYLMAVHKGLIGQ